MIPRFKPDIGWAELGALTARCAGAVERFEREFARSFEASEAVAFPMGAVRCGPCCRHSSCAVPRW